MSKFKFLCPKCGHAFLEGTSFHRCPQCQVPLLTAADNPSADLGQIPNHIDVDELLRECLTTQQPDEEIDTALKRTVKQKYPSAHDGLVRVLSRQLDLWQQLRGVSRQQAAEQLAKAHSELTVRPGGEPDVHTSVVTEIKGLENLPAEQQSAIKAQLEEALKSGKPFPKIMFTTTTNQNSGYGSAILFALFVGLTILFAILFKMRY